MANKTRNDSLLNSGISSALDRRVAIRQEELHKEREAQKASVAAKLGSLSDRGKIILDWIEQEKKDIADITKMVMAVQNEEDVRSQLLARQMYIGFLEKAKIRVKKYLKEDKS